MNYFSLLLMNFILFSCQENNINQKKTVSNDTLVINETKENVNFLHIQPTKTTLDSLQGLWQSDEDDSYEVRIIGDKWVDIHDKQEQSSTLFIISSYCNSENPKATQIGNFIIKIGALKPYICYEIDLLNNKELSIVYGDTKVQNFTKKE